MKSLPGHFSGYTISNNYSSWFNAPPRALPSFPQPRIFPFFFPFFSTLSFFWCGMCMRWFWPTLIRKNVEVKQIAKATPCGMFHTLPNPHYSSFCFFLTFFWVLTGFLAAATGPAIAIYLINHRAYYPGHFARIRGLEDFLSLQVERSLHGGTI